MKTKWNEPRHQEPNPDNKEKSKVKIKSKKWRNNHEELIEKNP